MPHGGWRVSGQVEAMCRARGEAARFGTGGGAAEKVEITCAAR